MEGPRRALPRAAALLAILALAACGGGLRPPGVERGAMGTLSGPDIDALMLASGDPGAAVDHFARGSEAEPARADLRRGLALSLGRAGDHEAAAAAWDQVIATGSATAEDRTERAGALVRLARWDAARAALDAIPPTHETYDRYRLEGILADVARQWDRADSFYEIAAGLTDTPAGIYNNWGYSRLSRGDPAGAERLFGRALAEEPDLFTAKNNLVLARGSRRDYALPAVRMTQEERAQLLHTLALTAIKQGDVATGRGLLIDAVASHPRHFEPAAAALAALGAPA